MLHTDITGNTLVVFGDLNTPINGKIVVEIANPFWDVKTTNAFLKDRLESRKAFGYTLQEQVNLCNNTFKPKQW